MRTWSEWLIAGIGLLAIIVILAVDWSKSRKLKDHGSE